MGGIDVSDLIGKPFDFGARGPDAYDCWGLVRECYHRWHGVALPDYPSAQTARINGETMEREAQESVWERRTSVIPGSIIMLRVDGFGAHVGFALSPTRMIHTMQNTRAVVTRTDRLKRQIMGAYLYAG